MPIVPPVVWFEGMALDPHHFQQGDRHHASVLDARLRGVRRHAWGATRVEVDADRLAAGEFHLTACAGVLPDGFAFDLGRTDPPPPPRTFAEAFPLADDRLPVYLALPLERPDGGAVTLADGPASRVGRFRAGTLAVADRNAGGEEREVEVARPDFRLLLGGEPRGEFVCLRVADVVRVAAGGYRLDDDVAPPALSLAAAPVLGRVARGLAEALQTYGADLARRRQQAFGRREVLPADLAVLLALQAAFGAAPLLRHHAATEGHPEDLYLTLAALAGELAALDRRGEAHPRTFPAYDHEAPAASLRALDALVRDLLGRALPDDGYVAIPLERREGGVYVGRVTEDGLLEAADLYLLGAGPLDDRQAALELPQQVRVASPDRMADVLKSYVRALPVQYVVRPPVQFPVRDGVHYLRLEKQGPFWDAILRAREVAVFLPAELPPLDLQLVALRPTA